MIKELAISAALVAALASLPFLFSPIQVAIGSFSDRHPLFGWRRSPYILLGLLLCVSGMVVLPQIAYILAEDRLLGLMLSLIAFGAWGMGYNLATVAYFSLASEVSGQEGRSRTIAFMFFMMIVAIILTSVGLSRLLETYTPDLLVRAFQLVGIIALGMGLVGILGLEPRRKKALEGTDSAAQEERSWAQIARSLTGNRQAMLFFWYLILLLTAILGQDILLEPYGAEAFDLPVSSTTRITSIWGSLFLVGLVLGGALEGRMSKIRIARIGAWCGVAAFGLISSSAFGDGIGIFYTGVVLLGMATGLSTVSNLSLMLDMTITGSVGLFIGAWGMASAIARLVGNVISGVIRDSITEIASNPVAGYTVVFGLELLLLLISLRLLGNIDVGLFHHEARDTVPLSERAALAGDLT
jgi:BCD family chlorophyll transporter-like MFS transporter